MSDRRFNERLHLMADIATMYYIDGHSQNEIARRVGRSRSAVSYMLQQAQEQGVVKFRINRPLVRDSELERALKQQFELPEVRVIKRHDVNEDENLGRLGQCAEVLLSEYLHNGMVKGISPGTSVRAAVLALRAEQTLTQRA